MGFIAIITLPLSIVIGGLTGGPIGIIAGLAIWYVLFAMPFYN